MLYLSNSNLVFVLEKRHSLIIKENATQERPLTSVTLVGLLSRCASKPFYNPLGPTVIKGKLLLSSYDQFCLVQYGEISR